MSPSAAEVAATARARALRELGSDSASPRVMMASKPRLAARCTPPVKARPRAQGRARTRFFFAISTDPTVDERDIVREIETVYETEKY
jgi:hypothetical protein